MKANHLIQKKSTSSCNTQPPTPTKTKIQQKHVANAEAVV
jgi:hypothetical protein